MDIYRKKIGGHLHINNPLQMWKGIQAITNFRGCSLAAPRGNSTLAEELNSFFAHFESKHQLTLPTTNPNPSTLTLCLREHEVRWVLRSVNPGKAAGPDGVTAKVIKACADQLAGILTKVFNLSLSCSTVPPCLKSSTIIPIPQKISY